MATPGPKTITKYTILTTTNWIPISWTLQGSNNDSDWTVLDTVVSDFVWPPAVTTYTVDDPGSYRYYKLNVTEIYGANNDVAIVELELIVSGSADECADMTADDAPIPFVVSASSIDGANNAAWKALDDNASTWWRSKYYATQWIKYDFGEVVGPEIASITPGSEQVGDPVTIAGTGFGALAGPASIVTFNGVEAWDILSWADTEIVIDVPVGATTGDVIVTVDGSPSPGEAFTVLGNPTISSLTPDYGWVGDPVTIAGTGFGAAQGGASVEFNGVTATITSWSDTEIVCTVPNTTTGDVVVKNV